MPSSTTSPPAQPQGVRLSDFQHAFCNIVALDQEFRAAKLLCIRSRASFVVRLRLMSHFFGDGSKSVPAAWHPEPNFRGTWTILSTCALTMFLCIWTVIHLNIPDQKRRRAQIWRKCGALIIGLLAPELIAWNAWEQRTSAKRLTRKMDSLRTRQYHLPYRKRKSIVDVFRSQWHQIVYSYYDMPGKLERKWRRARDGRPPPILRDNEPVDIENWALGTKEDTLYAWTETHSWYTLMGGFVFDVTSAEKPFIRNRRELLTLTDDGVLFVAEHFPHLLPRTSEESITARAKSDSLSKFIACWQATWFCVQIISRLAQGLSICLLELNVLGHAICALFIYGIWWNKPKDVEEPTKLTGEECNAVAALLYTLSPGQRPHSETVDSVTAKPGVTKTDDCDSSRAESYDLKNLAYPNHLDLHDSFWGLSNSSSQTAIDGTTRLWLGHHDHYPKDRLTAARMAQIRHYDLLVKETQDRFGSHRRNWHPLLVREAAYENTLVGYEKLLDELSEIFDGDVPWHVFSLTVATGLYGGIHAVAWDAFFPSSAERILWRVSCTTVAVSGLAILVVIILGYLAVWTLATSWNAVAKEILKQLWDSCVEYRPGLSVSAQRLRKVPSALNDWFKGLPTCVKYAFAALIVLPPFLLVYCTIIWYIFCRAFLVVESFINLAHLSESTLKTPNWSQYVPHIS